MFPRLFHIGSFSVPTYGFLVALGVLVGLWVSVRYAQKQGINPDDAWNFGIVVVLCGILGAKILYIINDWSTYAANPRQIFTLDTLQAGGVFSGGLLAAFLGAAWYIHKRRMPALATCDAFAPGLALGHVFGRLGCFSAGCCFGKPTTHFWGVVFTNPLANSISDTPLNVPLQPTQLFEGAAELGIFFVLAWMFRRKKFDGQIFGLYLILYGIARYLLEFIRDDPGRGSVFGGIISGTQLISIFLVIGGGLIWWLRPAMKAVPAQAVRAAR